MKKLWRSTAILLVLLLSVGTLLVACSNSNGTGNEGSTGKKNEVNQKPANEDKSKEEKVVLDYWTWWGSDTRRPVIEKIIKDFNDSQDRIEVKHTFQPYGDIWTKSLAQIAAGNPPDVIMNQSENTALRAKKQQNMNLAPFIKEDSSIKELFYEDSWNGVLHEGDPYALPFVIGNKVMFYNKKHFRDAGLDPEKFPTTWDELEEVSKLLDIKKGDRYERVGYAPQFGSCVWDCLGGNFDNGTIYFDANGNPAINTPGKVEALEYMLRFSDRIGQKNIDIMKGEFGVQQAEPFIAEKVSIFPSAITFYTQIRDYGPEMEYGIAPLPEKTPGSGHWTTGGGFVAEIPFGAKHPEESWEFVKYLGSAQAQAYWALLTLDNVPNKEVANDPELQKNPAYMASIDNLEWSRSYSIPVTAPDFKSLVNPYVDKALLGDMDPQKALDQAQADVENLIKKN